MKRLTLSSRIRIVSATILVLLSVVAGALYFHATSAHAAGIQIPPQAKAHAITVKPLFKNTGSTDPAKVLFSCQQNAAMPKCYGPQQMRQAYDITRVLNAGFKGAGSTIVIIDAFQSPTIQHDVDLFSTVFGLKKTVVNIIAPDGLTAFDQNDPNQVGWAGEITLDVEWAHAIAPDARIDLVLAKSNEDADILSATKFAIDNNLGDVISQSFGEGETCMDPALLAAQHQLFKQATKQGITLLASSGDTGAAQPTCDNSSLFLSASTPASDPLVTAVGGTYLNANAKNGTYIGETAWNDDFGASGGGYSTIYAHPNYQNAFNGKTMRGVPDVAYNAAVNSGVLVVWSSSGLGTDLVFIFGGTSAGSPQWAGIIALVDQFIGGRVGFLNPILYRGFAKANYAEFYHDITSGTNTFGGVQGYNTRTGWDAVTGLGSLIVGNTFFGPAGTTPNIPNPWQTSTTADAAAL